MTPLERVLIGFAIIFVGASLTVLGGIPWTYACIGFGAVVIVVGFGIVANMDTP
jgi:hypothetical protein